jgi:hypothetical protein
MFGGSQTCFSVLQTSQSFLACAHSAHSCETRERSRKGAKTRRGKCCRRVLCALVPFAPNLLDHSMRPLARRNVLSRIRSASRLFSNPGQQLVRLRTPGSRRPWSPVVSPAKMRLFPSHSKPRRGQGAKICPPVPVLSPFASWRLCVSPLSVAAGPRWVLCASVFQKSIETDNARDCAYEGWKHRGTETTE